MRMPVMTVKKLERLLATRKGAKIISFVALTEPDQVSWSPYKGKVRKRSYVNGIINWHYGNAVNNQRQREGQPLDRNGRVEHFVPLIRKWGERLPGLPWVEHNDQLYLEVKVQHSLGREYFDLEGNPIAPEDIKPYLRKKKESSRQKVQNPVILRDYTVTNIQHIKVNGVWYKMAA